ncbi:MAG: nicotinamide mononucleotide transporter [Magnetococcales bacterium]|nr:nicotinamide mononucleotide transporter [Magnetococcales bacterium]MBF0116404.1 nicotinamide mononucleotide transporter [Magnetococcales bacterium]
MDTLASLKWIGTVTGVAGALLVAMNIPQSGYGFLLFLLSSVSWFIAAYRMHEISLMILQAVFTVINLIGVWRWLFVN